MGFIGAIGRTGLDLCGWAGALGAPGCVPLDPLKRARLEVAFACCWACRLIFEPSEDGAELSEEDSPSSDANFNSPVPKVADSWLLRASCNLAIFFWLSMAVSFSDRGDQVGSPLKIVISCRNWFPIKVGREIIKFTTQPRYRSVWVVRNYSNFKPFSRANTPIRKECSHSLNNPYL